MESRSRRLPFLSSSSTSSLSSSSYCSSSTPGSSRLYGRSSVLSTDRYTSRCSISLDSEHQSSRFPSLSRDYSVPESRHSSWKLSSSSTSPSVPRDRSWADSSVGSRSKLGDSERRLGTYSGLLGTTQDADSKRPKLSYTNRSSYSRNLPSSLLGSSSTCVGSGSDSSWKSYSPLSRSSSSSSSSEGLRSRREVEDRSEATSSGYRSAGLSSLYRSDRLTSSYAQGARPKESLYSSSRLGSSIGYRSPTDYQPSSVSRDFCRSASRTPSLPPLRAPESISSSESRGSSTRSRYVPLSERNASSRPAPAPAPTPTHAEATESGDTEGRRTTRQMLSRLSRLANSMSSTLFPRRYSQDSSGSSFASRSFESSDDDSDVRREENSSDSSPDGSERGPEPSQGFTFLRRRRQGLSPVLETRSSESDSGRTPGAWLSSSLRSRCPPLFSRQRREGWDETARMATVSEDHCQSSQPLTSRRGATETKATDGDDKEDDKEETDGANAEGATASGASVQDSSQAARSQPLAGVPSNSLFRISVPPSLENSLPENVMITVDIMAAGRAADLQEKEKQTSSRDPEKLRKIQESLLLEESDEEEGDLCRICQMKEESPSNPLLEPCRCHGSLQYVHQDCMKKWLRSKIHSGSDLEAITTCELCKEKLHLDIDDFDIDELYRSHSEYEFISCGLYLVVLLHLCEQRFSDVLGAATDAGLFNLARTLHDMDDLESSFGETEGRVLQETRPSIDFSDLEDEDYEDY